MSRKPTRQAASDAKSKLIRLYGTSGSEAGSDEEEAPAPAAGPAGPTPPASVPRRASAGDAGQINPDPGNRESDGDSDGGDTPGSDESEADDNDFYDADSPNMSHDNANAAAGGNPPPPPHNFEDINGQDGPEVMGKVGSVKIPWDEDVEYFFFDLENQMEMINVQSQWVKRSILANNLPNHIRAEVKDTLKKVRAQVGPTVYKDIKVKVIKLYGRKVGENFERASQRLLLDKPSKLAKELVEDLCKCEDPLKCCA